MYAVLMRELLVVDIVVAINRTTYVRCPEGYESELGQLLELKRALYGLRDAPRLWYKHLTAMLGKLGLHQVPGVSCLFSNDHLVVFFFVDDIVVAVASENKDTYRHFDQQVRAAYDMGFLGELKWFLGICVIRDRSHKKIWLMQDSFIDKVAAKYNIAQGSTKYPAVPLVDGKIGPSTEEPDEQRTKLYQELVGSLAYISTYTRPDVAQAHLELSRYLQNPGQKHISATYHVWKYLIGQRHLAISAHRD